MAAMDYREISRILVAEGFSTDDIDAAIDSLVDAGEMTYADEDELLLTEDEVGVLRDQLNSSQAGEDRDAREAENRAAKEEYEAGMRGPGRPEVGRMVNVRMPEALIDGLTAEAEREGVPRAECIRRMLYLGLASTPNGAPRGLPIDIADEITRR